ncbi:MAG: phosphatidylglycerol lysyltransferase domain-containing protein [Candidatus Omnitrophica bacterium]|nr:phosphatidylglycerol lysyltransferase domain-containing protein [Candidatus Omnitrophota bacterium]
MSIPRYPHFEELSLDQKHIFDEILRKEQPKISEFTFTNLFSWRTAHRFSVSVFGDFLIVRSGNRPTPRFLKPLGEGNPREVIEQIFADSQGLFMALPETIKDLFTDDAHFTVELDRDNCDYLFVREDLVALKGSKYDGKRNLIKNFKSRYNYEYVALDSSNAAEALDFQERWCVLKNCESVEGLSSERKAIEEMLAHFEPFRLIGGAIRLEGKIYAIAIGEQLNSQTLVMHALKADPNITGLYQTINNEFLSRLPEYFRYVNFEQDLGIPGLRKAKLSYHPSEIVKKYTLRPVG